MDDLDFIADPKVPDLPHCINCDQPIVADIRFCNHCGFAQTTKNEESNNEKWNAIKQIALFFIIDAMICCMASFIDFFKTLSWSITFDIMMAITAVIFFCINWSKYRSLLVWHNFSITRLLGYCAMAVVGSFIVSFVVGWLNQSLFSKEFSYYAFYAGHTHGKLLVILFVAVMPALFEELGYRGLFTRQIPPGNRQKQAIFISGFIFAIMHTSFISLFWLIPFALLLGYVRVKENTLWYGVCIHFSFNFTVCMMDIMQHSHAHYH